MSISEGLYKHYKGNVYKVLGLARHSETQEDLVLYKTTMATSLVWARPLKMFEELVETPEGKVPRFKRL